LSNPKQLAQNCAVLEREHGLARELSTRQMAIGGAIGTGLFLGSSLAVHTAGPAVIGGLFVRVMIFVPHLFFRRAWEARGGERLPVRMVGYPDTSVLGAALVTGIIATTWWVPGMRPTILSSVPWLAFLTVIYWIWKRERVVHPPTLPVEAQGK
jgi:L-asparagine transporter-like permease